MTRNSTPFSKEDEKWMKKALKLAEKGRGYVSPNPLVGCIIVSADGSPLGKGYHERYGKAHAEINALNRVRNEHDLIDATVYVTLEPCSHYGKTPPCALALSELPIKRVVVAMEDPNPRVAGRGIQMLRNNGIQVDIGLLEEEAAQQNEFFIHHITTRRPFVMLKIAQTLDGYTAAQDGDSQWISSKESRTRVHQWRSIYDAVMIGRTTALLDNPRLTVRHIEGRQPARIIVDGPGELPEHLNLFNDQYVDKTYRITYNRALQGPAGDATTEEMLRLMQPHAYQGNIVQVSRHEGHADLDLALARLGELDIASVMVESGGTLATALLKQGLVDKVQLFIAPKLLGGGKRSILGLGIERMNEIVPFRKTHWEPCGEDMLFTGYL
ncbi:MAG: bifunctional diaminohydroxyphosphoribosylaminopyrimidine deaminase / 5-amino-6-(5-phosphoribosylamino)uracil reductase RibD [Bacteroidetes bacterium HLUCCA01]|nr:MAG: bifunctional diaminohydroxyphosphoribosylaminopyrimidine deaminase / 5-amino-6-(5-phosphoribosylamino)uracil reductase RibD [Bacteroidetes bacterium HLUCCA01]